MTFEEFLRVSQIQPGLLFPAQQLISKLDRELKKAGPKDGKGAVLWAVHGFFTRRLARKSIDMVTF